MYKRPLTVLIAVLGLGVALCPGSRAGEAAGVASVAAGEGHTCALTTDGGIKCWGDNFYGQLGDGTTDNIRPTPVDVLGLTSGASAVAIGSAGAEHTCALTGAGGVKCWGWNGYGQVGDGSNGNARSTPVDVSGLTSGVAALASGGVHTCAVTTGGGVKCWGYNQDGQLGNGTTVDSATPVDVVGLTSGVASVAPGGDHTCALTTTHGVKCWGRNQYGQLGDGQVCGALCSTPVDVSGLTSGVAVVAAGGEHTCAVTTTGAVKCWGRNDLGQLGDGQACGTLCTTPVNVAGLGSGATAVVAGDEHACARIGGGVKCWGWNLFGQLGDGQACGTSCAVPVNVVGLGSGVSAIAAGFEHNVAVVGGECVKSWGHNSTGQLGDGSQTGSSTPVTVTGLCAAPVGGIAELPDFAGASTDEAGAPAGSGWSAGDYAALAGGLTSTLVALTVGALYARRRSLRRRA